MAVSSLTTTNPCLTGRSRCSVARKDRQAPGTAGRVPCRTCKPITLSTEMTESAGAVMVRPALPGLQGHCPSYPINPFQLEDSGPGRGEAFRCHTNLSAVLPPPPRGWRILSWWRGVDHPLHLKIRDLHCAVLRAENLEVGQEIELS